MGSVRISSGCSCERTPLTAASIRSAWRSFALLDMEFTSPVTFFVGESGTGKSTVIVAIAIKRSAPPRRSKPT